MKPKPSPWLEAITTALTHQADKPGPGWKSRRQLESELGISEQSARRMTTKLIKAGLAETKPFMILANGALKRVAHYKLK